MADKKKKEFTISELKPIKNIDGDDLLLVSDREGGKYYTKSMTVQQLIQKTVDSIVSDPAIMSQITASATTAAVSAAVKQVDNVVVPEKIVTVIEQNYLSVLDALDGVMDDTFTIGKDSGSTNSQT